MPHHTCPSIARHGGYRGAHRCPNSCHLVGFGYSLEETIFAGIEGHEPVKEFEELLWREQTIGELLKGVPKVLLGQYKLGAGPDLTQRCGHTVCGRLGTFRAARNAVSVHVPG